jgi:aspartyl/asparaginyl beta-hydroxylase (cupin superfamily)
MSQAENPQLQQAFALLHQGRAGEAKGIFESLVNRLPDQPDAWLGLAYSCAGLGDEAAAATAVDRSLALDPRNLGALLFKADCIAAGGKPRRSLGYYQQALRIASTEPRHLPPEVRKGLDRAQAMVGRFTAEYGDFLLNGLRARGYRPDAASGRFNRSVDICLGRRQVYYQQPSRFYFAELPQRQFYERDEFPWLARLEAATGDIRDELLVVMGEPDSFGPYVKSTREFSGTDAATRRMIDNPDWGALYLWEYGRRVEKNAARFPRTMEALQDVPLPFIKDQLPMALFSRLAPRMTIPPHHGMLNTRLICHLPLVVPHDCGALRCGSEERLWVEGQALIFDDSIEHEARNRSDRDRVVLLFDIWRPELTQDERQLVTSVLEIVRDYNDRDD